jgi:hypothetical protein
MAEKWSDRHEQAYHELVERLRFWGYQVPSGEKQMDPALLLMLKTFAHHTVATEDRLRGATEEVIDSFVSEFFLTGLKRPVPAYTMISCLCSDNRAVVENDLEFRCSIGGPRPRDYTFYPLYSQEIFEINADLVIFTSGEYLRVLKTLPDETENWEQGLDSPAYRNMKRQEPPPRGGTFYVGITSALNLEDVEGIPLYLGPDGRIGHALKWADWSTLGEDGYGDSFKTGKYEDRLEIFKHLDIREYEFDSNFESRLYSSDLLTSGKTMWHFKHYLSAARNFAYIPAEYLKFAGKTTIPPDVESRFAHLDYSGLSTPRWWLKIDLPPDHEVGDLRRYRYFDSNTVLLINRNKLHRNKYTMGQPVLEVNLFDMPTYEGEHLPDKLFAIERVWDSREEEYVNSLDMSAYGNPRKYVVADEENSVKVKFDFQRSSRVPPDFVVVEYSLTDGENGNGIGSDVEIELAGEHPQLVGIRNLVTSSGGSNAKTPEEIKRIVGFFIRNHGTALSNSEIEFLARSFDTRISKARAERTILPTDGGLVPAVRVAVSLNPEVKITDEEREWIIERLGAYLDCYTPLNLRLKAEMAVD